jgi:formylglycine-generating enzyme required for sulfatase activity/predicted Ser/Thr protein kinase
MTDEPHTQREEEGGPQGLHDGETEVSPERTLQFSAPDLPAEGDDEGFQLAETMKEPAPGTASEDGFQYAETMKEPAPGAPVAQGFHFEEHELQAAQDEGYGSTINDPADSQRTMITGAEPDSQSPTAAPPPSSGAGSSSSRPRSSKAGLRSAQQTRQGGPETGELYAGKYELLDEIARGGMGVVYQARQVDLNRIVALKVMLAGNYASEDDRRRFILEAEASARLKHPNIVPVFDIGEVEGNLYFTMDYVEGAPLSDRKLELTRAQLGEVMIKVCSGVAYAHQRGIIHRDLKPANIMMNAQDEPLIMDFGLAKQVELTDSEGRPDSRTREGQVMGTPHYMPPEQAEGTISEIDVRSDVWALGVILYELWCRELPFKGKGFSELMLRIFESDPKPPRQVDPSIDADMEAIILKTLEKDKDKRYQSAGDLQEDLENRAAGRPISARRATPLYRLQKWSRRNRLPILVAAAFLAVVGGFGGFGIQQYRAGERQQRLTREKARDDLVADFTHALAAVSGEQERLSAAVATAREAAHELLQREGRLKARAEGAGQWVAKVSELNEELVALATSLQRFAGSEILENLQGEAAAEERTRREQEAALATDRTTLRDRLNTLTRTLQRLLEAQGALRAVQALRPEVVKAAESATEATSGAESGGATRGWKSLEEALAKVKGSQGDASTQGPKANAGAFPAATERYRSGLFRVVGLAAYAPEQDAAKSELAWLTQQDIRVAAARASQAHMREARERKLDAVSVLTLLDASRKTSSGDDETNQLHLRAARVAQGLVQEALERVPATPAKTGLRDRLIALRHRTNAAYSHVLLDVEAWNVYMAEIGVEGAFTKPDFTALQTRYLSLTSAKGQLEARLRAKSQEPLQGLSVILLLKRRTEMKSLAAEVAKDPALLDVARQRIGILQSEIEERAREDLDQAIRAALDQVSRTAAEDRARKLDALEGRFASARALLRDYTQRRRDLGLESAALRKLEDSLSLGLVALYREVALAEEDSDPQAAADVASKASLEYARVSSGRQEAQERQNLRKLARRLQRAEATPKGMVLIRGRTLTLGGGPQDRNPLREVEVKSFYLSTHEVTNSEYLEFVRGAFRSEALWAKLGHSKQDVSVPRGWEGLEPPKGSENLPVTGITWIEARGYAESRGRRLPTDREWEYAVRLRAGVARPSPSVFPWAGAWRPGALRSELRSPGANPLDVNSEGVFDLAGNVSEWVVLQQGTTPGAAARGASYLYPVARIARAGHRLRPLPTYQGPQLGLRLAKDAAR